MGFNAKISGIIENMHLVFLIFGKIRVLALALAFCFGGIKVEIVPWTESSGDKNYRHASFDVDGYLPVQRSDFAFQGSPF